MNIGLLTDHYAAFAAIAAERQRQDAKFGEQNGDDYLWLAILTEEVGEIANAIIERDYREAPEAAVEAEMVQVAAVCVAWLECRARRGAAVS